MGNPADQDGARGDAAGRRFGFGDVLFDGEQLKLYVRGRQTALELKPLEVLQYLLQRPNKAIGKDDLVKAVWPGRVISDSALTSTIAKLREALGDDADAIKTVHGFGYRLEAEVRAVAGSDRPYAPSDALQPSRRLAAIMFTDLVGYSALAHRDEKLAIELLEEHRRWIREIIPKHGGVEIETVGDAFLIEFSGALAAVECALAIQQRFADQNKAAPEDRRMQLRIGIHLGDVEHKDGKVMGDGVNIASRIHGNAEPGGICISGAVYEVVRNRLGEGFSSIGTPALKNIARAPELFVHGPATPPAWAAVRKWRRPLSAGAAAAGALAVAASMLWPAGERPAARPSVAVLPFENLSSDKDSAYFADGIHDTVIAHLAKVRDLKTISRTSVMEYRDARRNLRDIGRALDVAHIVEGTVQRAGGRVRITAQLIKVSDDQHLWAESYDRELSDVFGVQSEIARNVAQGVRAQLTAAEIAKIVRRPTADPEAYDLYLRARRLWEQPKTEKTLRESLALAQGAVAKDSEFALAHALVSRLYTWLYWLFNDRPAAPLARGAAERSISLQSDLAEGHLALGHMLYWCERDYAGALAALERARQLAPGEASIPLWTGFVLRRQGKLREALEQLEQATIIDPANGGVVVDYARMLQDMRLYERAERAFDQAILFGAHDDASATTYKAYTTFLRTGDPHRLLEALKSVSATDKLALNSHRYAALLFTRDFEAAARVAIEDSEEVWWGVGSQAIPRHSAIALAYALGGRLDRARPYAAKARDFLQKQLDDDPAKAHVRIYLAFALHHQGEEARARVEGRRVLEDLARWSDPVEKPALARDAAHLFAFIGEQDTALELLGDSLQAPLGIHLEEARHSPFFERLREDVRFKKLIADAERTRAS